MFARYPTVSKRILTSDFSAFFVNLQHDHVLKYYRNAEFFLLMHRRFQIMKIRTRKHTGINQERMLLSHSWLKILFSFYASSNTILFTALIYALILAATISVEIPLPEYSFPLLRSLTTAEPRASLPSVTD